MDASAPDKADSDEEEARTEKQRYDYAADSKGCPLKDRHVSQHTQKDYADQREGDGAYVHNNF